MIETILVFSFSFIGDGEEGLVSNFRNGSI
jgi:hypothetical protein